MADHAQNMNIHAPPSPKLFGAMPCRMVRSRPLQPHRHSSWLLEMFTSGQLSVSIEGGPWRAFGKGRGILYAPGTSFHERLVPRGMVCESLYLLFALPGTPPFDAWATRAPAYRIIDDRRRLLLPLVEQAVRHHELPGADALLAHGAFLQTLGRLLTAATAGDALVIADDSSDEDLVTRLDRRMRAGLGEPLSLARLADATGMSESGLSHAYRRLTGTTPMATLRRMRIDAAKAHLAARRLSLSEIADLTGFSDAFHLSRTFKQIVGMSPRDYRKQADDA
jgi:AraC-like DNA-binding protein